VDSSPRYMHKGSAMKLTTTSLLIASAVGAVAAVSVYSGAFNIAADVPHSSVVYELMEAVRDRSIAVRIGDVQVPPLDDPKLAAEGAKHYAAMCVDCHLAPGVKDSELRKGLYPQPPNLAEHIHAGPAEKFWVIKHGIKMSAMPAWGKTHDDQSIWGLVAFLQKLPELTPEQYQALVDAGGESAAHHHGRDESGQGGDHNGHTHHLSGIGAHNP
jgi:mono/diheme cytochrome c family protein